MYKQAFCDEGFIQAEFAKKYFLEYISLVKLFVFWERSVTNESKYGWLKSMKFFSFWLFVQLLLSVLLIITIHDV